MFNSTHAVPLLMSSGAGDQLESDCLIKTYWNGCS